VTDCNADWKPLWPIIYEEGYQMQIAPEDYLVDVSENGDGSVCHLLLVANNFNFYLYGMPLFKGYYAAHNIKPEGGDGHSAIGWAPSDRSFKEYVKKGPIPDQVLEIPQPNTLVIFAIVVLIIFILIGTGVIAWASNEYGSSSTNFYIIIAAYSITAFILFVCIMVIFGGMVSNMNVSSSPPDPTDPNSVDTATNSGGVQPQALFNMAAIGFVGYFAYKFMALKKAAAARATSTEGKDDLMMYSANGMD